MEKRLEAPVRLAVKFLEEHGYRDLGGWIARVFTAEDLIISKVVAGREKDWLDLPMLLRAQVGRLDESYVQYWLSQFAEALENPELLTKYRQLLEKSKRSQP